MNTVFPAWIYCTRYSDRPSSGPRSRRTKRKETNLNDDEKRPRTAFTAEQLERLKQQFMDNRYLTEKRRQELAHELGLNESQIKIWFQNIECRVLPIKSNINYSGSMEILKQASKTEESIRTSTCFGSAFDGSGTLQSHIDANIQSTLE